MFEFGFTEEQNMLRDMVRDFTGTDFFVIFCLASFLNFLLCFCHLY